MKLVWDEAAWEAEGVCTTVRSDNWFDPVHGLDWRGERAVLVAFSVTPLGIGEGVGEVVAEAVRVVRESGLPNRTDAMFTTVEGDWDEVMGVVKRAVEAVAARAPRVSLVLKADLRPGVTGALTAKVEAVERYLAG